MDESLQSARELLQRQLVWDNHSCMPLRPGDHAFLPQLERVHASGVDAVALNIGFGTLDLATHLRQLADFRQWLGARSDRFQLVSSTADIDSARQEGRLAVFFDIEGMAPLDDGDFGVLALLRELGVGWMLVAYNRANAAGGGCLDDEDEGLTTHGRALLAEMKRVGMLVCCSHTGHRTAREVIDAADNPVLFSHSNAAAVHPHYRNIPDELITAVAANGGVVGVNGVGDFLGEGDDYAELLYRHIDHMVSLVGSAHVGVALDYVFDQGELIEYLRTMEHTFGDNVPDENDLRFAPPEVFPALTARMLRAGYAESDIANIVGGNWYRVASQVWQGAA